MSFQAEPRITGAMNASIAGVRLSDSNPERVASGPAEHYLAGMQFGFSTPALLFPAISLLFISYTTRFVTYANLVRGLHDRWRSDHEPVLEEQIANLRYRIRLIRLMQLLGALSLVAAATSMLLLFFQALVVAEIAFVISLALLVASMLTLVREVAVSTNALEVQLRDMTGE